MNFDLNDEQRLLTESVSRLMMDRYDFNQRKTYAMSEEGFSPAMWQAYGELGLLALPFSEDDGGIGGGPVEIMIIMEEIGRALALEPYLPHIVMSASLLRHAASPEQRARLLPGMMDGTRHIAPALGEMTGGYDLSHVRTTAREEGAGFRLDGAKTLVLHGGCAHTFLVSARLQGRPADQQGIGLFVVEADDKGVSHRPYRTQDGQSAAELMLADVHVAKDMMLACGSEAGPAIARMADEAIAAIAAEAVGAMDSLVKGTVDYLKVRKQFGQVIGNFQALQHRAADMVVELEQARSMALYATMMSRHEDAIARAAAISSAKVQINRSARLIAQACVQLHGGIGMTMEHPAGHYMKRLTMIEKTLGDSDFHMDRLASDTNG
ncbi:acyl-CoA dehydrogenase family protein [Candidatus Raskinella chloraquaticus]|uniref:Pimeloyl-CoA dehydrogenase small subunit n=1 Tax=Candidatus Raskinella chloraquaticus TaxID=1951219 RepID=A0A1W9HQV8_9HYPH|nr:MAG: pimeloyl-CoA dehydrogenase small subunit [Proteobacteria bacterium SG_bin8]